MKKKEYKKPSMKVVLLQQQCRLLAGSPEQIPGWDGEGD